MTIKIHSKALNFKLPNQDNELVELNKIKDNIILFFYPKSYISIFESATVLI